MSVQDSSNQQLVGLLYRDHRDWLFGWLRKSLNCAQRAEDLSQDTFVRLLGQLSSKARAAFLYNRLDGLGHAEIAERLGVSPSRVRQYLAQGLRQCYIALYGAPQ